jgi:hypothetical protein
MPATTNLYTLAASAGPPDGFTSAVSLHGHTLHSREGMQFIPRMAARIAPLRIAIDYAARRRGASGMDGVDWSRVWWTPPLTPRQAMELEESQITALGLEPLVSLTDHDDISAPLQLSALPQWSGRIPVSVEWTFPFRGTFFHLGVHNLPASDGTGIWEELEAATRSNCEKRLFSTLASVRAVPGTLIVLNHPMWDEKGIGIARHRRRLDAFAALAAPHLDALELNGMRPAQENDDALAYASEHGIPVVSGGDRHGIEANSCLNLTNARSFAEFATEIRHRRVSHILLMPHHHQHRTWRVIRHIWEILRDEPDHGLGWRRWDDRMFYRDKAGVEHSLREMWNGRPPRIVSAFVGLVKLMGHAGVRNAVRAALSVEQETGL